MNTASTANIRPTIIHILTKPPTDCFTIGRVYYLHVSMMAVIIYQLWVLQGEAPVIYLLITFQSRDFPKEYGPAIWFFLVSLLALPRVRKSSEHVRGPVA